MKSHPLMPRSLGGTASPVRTASSRPLQCSREAFSRRLRNLRQEHGDVRDVDAGDGERVPGVHCGKHGRGATCRHRVQCELRADIRRPDRVHRNGSDDVRRGAAGDGRIHHLSLGGAECGVDIRVARHQTVGPRIGGCRCARGSPRQPRIRRRGVRLHAGPNRAGRFVVLDRRRRDGRVGGWHRVRQVDGVQPAAAVS